MKCHGILQYLCIDLFFLKRLDKFYRYWIFLQLRRLFIYQSETNVISQKQIGFKSLPE